MLVVDEPHPLPAGGVLPGGKDSSRRPMTSNECDGISVSLVRNIFVSKIKGAKSVLLRVRRASGQKSLYLFVICAVARAVRRFNSSEREIMHDDDIQKIKYK